MRGPGTTTGSAALDYHFEDVFRALKAQMTETDDSLEFMQKVKTDLENVTAYDPPEKHIVVDRVFWYDGSTPTSFVARGFERSCLTRVRMSRGNIVRNVFVWWRRR